MAENPAHGQDVTELLHRWKGGERGALDRLTSLVYDELHRIASRALSRERADHTLQSTALVHEAFVRLVDQTRVEWQSRAHFFGLAAQLMRRILVDHARRTSRRKRGGDAINVALEVVGDVADREGMDLADTLTIDEALRKLEALDPVQGHIVELRFFGGLTIEETADVVGLSPTSVKREWAVAKAWLHREVSGLSA
jgi:RNA polymerase sigma factor (TIGR02999 family)